MKLPLVACVLVAGLLRLPAAESKPISVTVGEDFKITLKCNPSTGYQWQIPSPPDEKLLTVSTPEYKRSDTNLVGAPIDEIWTCKALAEGKVKIEFGYVRPWEKGAKPAQTTNIVVIIKPAKTETNKPSPPG